MKEKNKTPVGLRVRSLNVLRVQDMRPDVSKLSKKKMRRMNRLTVAELKQVR